MSRALSEGKDVVMLCRRNGLPWFVNFPEGGQGGGRSLSNYLELLRSLFSKEIGEKISISTAHKYKGLEKSVVIVMDAVARSYPLIHPDWVFSRILGDTPAEVTKEERRLFYVALTRAIDQLVIITEQRNHSPFIAEVTKNMVLGEIDWNQLPPVQSKSMRLLVLVGNQQGRGISPTYAIRDQLKASGYQWQSKGWAGWAKDFQASGFDILRLQKEVWAGEADGVEVRVLDDSERQIARYLVNAGNWACKLDKLDSVASAQVEEQEAQVQSAARYSSD